MYVCRQKYNPMSGVTSNNWPRNADTLNKGHKRCRINQSVLDESENTMFRIKQNPWLGQREREIAMGMVELSPISPAFTLKCENVLFNLCAFLLLLICWGVCVCGAVRVHTCIVAQRNRWWDGKKSSLLLSGICSWILFCWHLFLASIHTNIVSRFHAKIWNVERKK